MQCRIVSSHRNLFVAFATALIVTAATGFTGRSALAEAPNTVAALAAAPALELVVAPSEEGAGVDTRTTPALGTSFAQALEPYVPQGLAVAQPEHGETRLDQPEVDSLAPDAIVGSEDRIEAPVSLYPYSAIGRIDASLGSKSWSCTGVLVARGIMLTNRHCVYDTEQRRLATSVMFTPGYRRGEAPFGQAYGKKVYLSGIIRMTGQPLDYALVTLSQNLGDQAGWLGVKPFQTTWVPSPAQWTLAGYGFNWYGNRGNTTVQTYNAVPCRLLDLSEGNNIVGHDCDSGGGNSGSPIFGWFGDGTGRNRPYAVAVNYAEWRLVDKFSSCGAYQSGSCGNLAVQSQAFLGRLLSLSKGQR